MQQAVICLTADLIEYDYSFFNGLGNEHGNMSTNCPDNASPLVALKRRSAQQRWEVFHRAIAYAKQSNLISMKDSDTLSQEDIPTVPVMKIVK